MSTGAFPLGILAGITVGFMASPDIQNTYSGTVSQAAGVGFGFLAILHNEVAGRGAGVPQGQKIMIQAPLIGVALGLYFAPRFRVHNVTVYGDDSDE
eukprot:CFRG5082T1